MMYQTLQMGQQRHKEMMREAEKQRLLALIRVRKTGSRPVLRIVRMGAGRLLIAAGRLLNPQLTESDVEIRLNSTS